MKQKEFGIEGPLCRELIDRCAGKTEAYVQELVSDRKAQLRLRLSVEEILLKWQNHYGETAMVKVSGFSRLGQPVLKLSLAGEPWDPLQENAEETEAWSKRILAGLETTPVYSYSRNVNTVTIKPVVPKRSVLVRLLAAITVAAAVGGLGFLLPETIRITAAEQWLLPVSQTFLDVFGFCGIPLIFLAVALGICGVGDVTAFSRIGKRMVCHFMLCLLLTTVLAAAAAYPFFRFTWGEGSVSVGYSAYLQMLLDIFPTNLLQPFLDCNAIQLIIMGALCGIGLLKLDPLTMGMSNFLEDLNSLLLLAARWLAELIPVFVFIIVVKSMWLGEMAQILSAWTSLAVTTALQILYLVLVAAQICIRHQVKPGILLRKVSATFLIALGTDSCVVTVPEIYSCCGKLGVSGQLFGFGIPIGTSIFKPSCAIRLVVLSYFMASSYKIMVSPLWFVMVVIVCTVLSIAVPAIPSGAMLFFPMLFSQLGLPAEALTVMLATDIFFDAICTACAQVSVELALVQQAGSMGLLDCDKLRSREI